MPRGAQAPRTHCIVLLRGFAGAMCKLRKNNQHCQPPYPACSHVRRVLMIRLVVELEIVCLQFQLRHSGKAVGHDSIDGGHHFYWDCQYRVAARLLVLHQQSTGHVRQRLIWHLCCVCQEG
jgi:hypothetical protein